MEENSEKIVKLKRDEDEVRRDSNQRERLAGDEKTKIQVDVHKLQGVLRDMEAFEKTGGKARLAQIEGEIEENEVKRKECVRQVQEFAARLQDIQTKVAKIQEMEQKVVQNLKHRRLKDEIRQYEKEIEGSLSSTEKLPPKEQLQADMKGIQAKLDDSKRRKHFSEGGTQELHALVRKSEQDLRSDLYKDIDQRYRDELIRLKTTEMSLSDLEKYMKAIDMSVPFPFLFLLLLLFSLSPSLK